MMPSNEHDANAVRHSLYPAVMPIQQTKSSDGILPFMPPSSAARGLLFDSDLVLKSLYCIYSSGETAESQLGLELLLPSPLAPEFLRNVLITHTDMHSV